MHIMARFRGAPQSMFALVGFCCVLSLSQGCARSEPQHPTDAGLPGSEQGLPFHPDTDRNSASHAISPDPKIVGGLPFQAGAHQHILPAGTLLTVQLEDSLSATRVRPGDTFTAFVAAPVTIDGDTLLQRGAAVSGRIESAQSQANRPGLASDLHYSGSGYLRLTLSAITVEDRQIAVQTSSLFARGPLQQANGIQVQKGRRLTFRLTAPLALDDPHSLANGQYARPTSE
jgi:hypothetical protein